MMRALWLTSWYPNKSDAMTGDFIQRQAKAVSLFCKVDVIHVDMDKSHVFAKTLDVDVKREGHLSETIILFRSPQIPLAGKIVSFFRYLNLFKKYIAKYIEANGVPEIAHVHVPIKAGILALWIKKKYRIPYVITEHWTIYNERTDDSYDKRDPVFKYFTKKVFRGADRFLPVSDDLGRAVQRVVTPVPFSVIPNVADTYHFNDLSSEDRAMDSFRFIHVSTLRHQKNPEGILRAYVKFIKEFPSTQLVIVGDDHERLEHYAMTLQLPLPNIVFKGLISYENVAVEMKRSDALVLFSRFENLPCVIIEALCCGLPVISTNVGGVPELIDESNGILISNEDEDALLDSMKQLYLNYSRYDKRAISESAQRKFSYQTIGREIYDVYREVLFPARRETDE